VLHAGETDRETSSRAFGSSQQSPHTGFDSRAHGPTGSCRNSLQRASGTPRSDISDGISFTSSADPEPQRAPTPHCGTSLDGAPAAALAAMLAIRYGPSHCGTAATHCGRDHPRPSDHDRMPRARRTSAASFSRSRTTGVPRVLHARSVRSGRFRPTCQRTSRLELPAASRQNMWPRTSCRGTAVPARAAVVLSSWMLTHRPPHRRASPGPGTARRRHRLASPRHPMTSRRHLRPGSASICRRVVVMSKCRGAHAAILPRYHRPSVHCPHAIADRERFRPAER